jgi:hypothetical protein
MRDNVIEFKRRTKSLKTLVAEELKRAPPSSIERALLALTMEELLRVSVRMHRTAIL